MLINTKCSFIYIYGHLIDVIGVTLWLGLNSNVILLRRVSFLTKWPFLVMGEKTILDFVQCRFFSLTNRFWTKSDQRSIFGQTSCGISLHMFALTWTLILGNTSKIKSFHINIYKYMYSLPKRCQKGWIGWYIFLLRYWGEQQTSYFLPLLCTHVLGISPSFIPAGHPHVTESSVRTMIPGQVHTSLLSTVSQKCEHFRGWPSIKQETIIGKISVDVMKFLGFIIAVASEKPCCHSIINQKKHIMSLSTFYLTIFNLFNQLFKNHSRSVEVFTHRVPFVSAAIQPVNTTVPTQANTRL